jgi:hypothetical protein
VITLRLRGRLWIAGCFAAFTVGVCLYNLRSKAHTNPRAVASAEDEVYGAVVRDLYTPKHGQSSVSDLKISLLVFNNSADIFLCAGLDRKTCVDGLRQRLRSAADGRVLPETIEDFIERSQTPGPLSATFHTDLPRTFIASESVYFDIEPIEKDGQKPFSELFPGASGIISFSHVGFDSTLHEAIVSTSFICGGLCGAGRRYILRKKWGRWEVADKWIVWVS